MNTYRQLIRPILFALSPERAHGLGVAALRLGGTFPGVTRALLRTTASDSPRLATTAFGAPFRNPLGVAAGLLKTAHGIAGAHATGFGFVEVGTITPQPQPGNAGVRMFRFPESDAVINRLGFPSLGMHAAAKVLAAAAPYPCPVLVNIGKNKATPNEEAARDYASAAEALAPHATALVLNVSSPNTPGLRDLAEESSLSGIIEATRRAAPRTPLLVKLSPDAADASVDASVDVCVSHQVAGVIATNTTRRREGVPANAPSEGGLSGPPLRLRATEVVRRVFQRTGGRLPIIGVGGISSVESALEKILAGASLLQLYTALVFEGPGLPSEILEGLDAEVARRGAQHLRELIGAGNSN